MFGEVLNGSKQWTTIRTKTFFLKNLHDIDKV